ncbi:MAG: class I SAM-dependent methyltransferase, partial [bacterium]|nr:class I SAM-dependent methyltransferase [bacterium]
MKLSRRTGIRINFILDHCLPPFLRDSKWFMWAPFYFLYGKKASIFLDFKEKALNMSEDEFADAYRQVEPVLMERETDLETRCFEEVVQSIRGRSVLEVGCGK